MNSEPDFTELAEFVKKWKQRNEERTALKIEVSLDVKVYSQEEPRPA